jgi:hypothetical protein
MPDPYRLFFCNLQHYRPTPEPLSGMLQKMFISLKPEQLVYSCQ